MRPTVLTASWYAVLATGLALFLIHGSLVPYNFEWRSFAEILADFETAMSRRLSISLSDVLANWLIAVALGYCLLGLSRVDRPGQRGAWLAMMAWLPVCGLLSTGVEFAQLYLPDRNCSRSDILAQLIGVLSGFLLWLAVGQWLTDRVRLLASHPLAGGRYGVRFLVYFCFLILVQIQPGDLTISPKAIYNRFKYGEVALVPFADWASPSQGHRRMLESLLLAMLCLPLGWALALWPGWQLRGRVLLGGLVLVGILETIQLFVESRRPSTTEAICGLVGVLLGGVIAFKWRPKSAAIAG